MTVNQAAFCTITSLAVVTGASVFLAATTASTVAMVAFAALGITGAGLSIGAITAWLAMKDGETAKDYFEKAKDHSAVSVAGMYQFVAQTLVQALVKGLGDGISAFFRRKIAGPDVTYSRV